jgi:hypothetical protein
MRTNWLSYRNHLLGAMGLVPALVACEGEPAEAWDQDEISSLPTDQAGPPLGLTQPGALLTGTEIGFRVTGATPGARVFLAGASQQGPGPCPPVLGGTCLDLASPFLLGSAVADGTGLARIAATLPHELADGLTIYFQAVEAGNASGVLSDVTSHPARVCGDVPWLDDTTYYAYPEVLACGPIPASGVCPTAASLTYSQEQWLFEYATGFQPLWVGYELDAVCDETSVQDACCFYSYMLPGPVIGRPFEVCGEARLADVGSDPSWCAALDLDTSALSRAERKRLAWAWTRHARGEHASVAAFSRFILQLMQLGAPAELVVDATRAMADEIRHARDAFGVASALAGETVGAGAIDTAGALDAMDVEAIVRSAIREGCIGETIAAAQAAAARDVCTVPEVREILARIADDEARHAALAWRFVRWAIGARPELADLLRDELAVGHPVQVAAPDAYADALRAWGQLPDTDMYAVARQVYAAVVQPCGAGLLGDRAFEAAA